MRKPLNDMVNASEFAERHFTAVAIDAAHSGVSAKDAIRMIDEAANGSAGAFPAIVTDANQHWTHAERALRCSIAVCLPALGADWMRTIVSNRMPT